MAAKGPNNPFDVPIPGSSLTKAPGSMPWQKAPKYTKLNDACNYIFGQITSEAKLRHLMTLMQHKVPLEAIARSIIMGGFSEGMWTPDLALQLGHPIMYMLAAIAKRANLDVPVTSADRSGMKEIVAFKRQMMSSSGASSVEPQKPAAQPKVRGLLQPAGQ